MLPGGWRLTDDLPSGRSNMSVLNRKYQVNHQAFVDAPSNPITAYWIGFLMADGSVGISKKGQHTLKLYLSEKDINHVRSFLEFLKSDYPIRTVLNDRGYNGSKPLAGITITSKDLVGSLSLYGVVPRKSETAKVKLLQNNHHFWRGCFDGDGHIFITEGYPHIGLSGSLDLIQQFASFVKYSTNIKISVTKNNSIWAAKTSGERAAKVVKCLYSNSSVCLERKRVIANKVIDWKSSKPDRSLWTFDFLCEQKKIHKTWANTGTALGVSANTLAVRFYQLKHKGA